MYSLSHLTSFLSINSFHGVLLKYLAQLLIEDFSMSQPYEYLWSNYAHGMFGHVNWGYPKIIFGMTGKNKTDTCHNKSPP